LEIFKGKTFDDGPLRSKVIPKITRVPSVNTTPPFVYRLYVFNRETHIESKYAILYRECEATFSYLLLCFVPQFSAATGIIAIESVIFQMRFCVYKKS